MSSGERQGHPRSPRCRAGRRRARALYDSRPRGDGSAPTRRSVAKGLVRRAGTVSARSGHYAWPVFHCFGKPTPTAATAKEGARARPGPGCRSCPLGGSAASAHALRERRHGAPLRVGAPCAGRSAGRPGCRSSSPAKAVRGHCVDTHLGQPCQQGSPRAHASRNRFERHHLHLGVFGRVGSQTRPDASRFCDEAREMVSLVHLAPRDHRCGAPTLRQGLDHPLVIAGSQRPDRHARGGVLKITGHGHNDAAAHQGTSLSDSLSVKMK